MNAQPNRGLNLVVGFTGAILVGGVVLVSSLIALLPQFQFESQFAAMVPFFAWAAAPGVAAVSHRLRNVVGPWRANLGLVSLIPYVALLVTVAAIRGPRWTSLPWWWAAIAGVSAALPFLVAGFRKAPRKPRPPRKVTADSQRGTFLLAAALMALAWSMVGPRFAGALLQVLIVAALVFAALRPSGLAGAATSWRLGHWASLLFATILMWAGYLLGPTTDLLDSIFAQVALVLLAGLPLAVWNRLDGRHTNS